MPVGFGALVSGIHQRDIFIGQFRQNMIDLYRKNTVFSRYLRVAVIVRKLQVRELTGTVENGDVVNIDYAGTIDGTAFEGGTAKEFSPSCHHKK